jgi:tRNA(adenine34) deaminase
MREALRQAHLAANEGEIPVGAVVVKNGFVIATGRNAPLAQSDPTGHAEVIALRAAAQALGNYRLDGCTLYVTLEPCSMCSGAMLHARLARVVFGAADPKTGAAGSVVNLFENTQLNHQTSVEGGVLAVECATVLQEFFGQLRVRNAADKVLLRDDALRTASSRFDTLTDYPWQPRYRSDLAGIEGLRLHYLDEGSANAPLTFLCLHGYTAWSYEYRRMIAVWQSAGHRIVAPDLIGFGKSDKPKREAFHTLDLHSKYLIDLINKLDLTGVVLVFHGVDSRLGLTLPMASPERYAGVLVMGTPFAGIASHSSSSEYEAFEAPFPDSGHRAAVRAFARTPTQFFVSPFDSLPANTFRFWTHEWRGQSLVAIGPGDTEAGMAETKKLRSMIRGCPEPLVLGSPEHSGDDYRQELAKVALAAYQRP